MGCNLESGIVVICLASFFVRPAVCSNCHNEISFLVFETKGEACKRERINAEYLSCTRWWVSQEDRDQIVVCPHLSGKLAPPMVGGHFRLQMA